MIDRRNEYYSQRKWLAFDGAFQRYKNQLYHQFKERFNIIKMFFVCQYILNSILRICFKNVEKYFYVSTNFYGKRHFLKFPFKKIIAIYIFLIDFGICNIRVRYFKTCLRFLTLLSGLVNVCWYIRRKYSRNVFLRDPSFST